MTRADHVPRLSGFRARLTDHVAVAVGTTQGLFMVRGGRPHGPLFSESTVPAFLQLGNRYYVATIDPGIGPTLQMSDDGGLSWSEPGAVAIAFPPETGEQLVQIRQLEMDRSSPTSSSSAFGLFAGVAPAALLRSRDGVTFELVHGLWDHPDRPAWGVGAVVHTVLSHRDRPGRITVAIANGGVYRSDDSGDTWQAKSSGMGVRSGHDHSSGVAPRLYKLAFDSSGPDVLLAQTDIGIYRSEDAGDSWVRVGRPGKASGVASKFGFPVVGHSVEAGTAFVFPLGSDSYPGTLHGLPSSHRTTGTGTLRGALRARLGKKDAPLTVLDDAFTVGEGPPYPLAFGTQTGELFASVDFGDNWRLVVSELPPVLCVRVLE
jgi:hypothetical protein